MSLRAGCGAAALIVLFAASACKPPDIAYAPPEQRQMPEGVDPLARELMFRMDSGAVQRRIVQDVMGAAPGSEWRWTNQRPRFQLLFDDVGNWRYRVQFTVPKVVLDQVGPVTLQFRVNDQVVAVRRIQKDGPYDLDEPVSAELLSKANPVVFGFDVDPVFIAPSDGVKLGVLLHSIGFVKGRRP